MPADPGPATATGVVAVPAATDPAVAHRIQAATLALSDHRGQPIADREVTIARTRHAFGFGNIGFSLVPLANDEVSGETRHCLQREAEQYLALFNATTLPFYWARFEPVRGAPDTRRLLRAAQWFVQ